MRTLKVGIASYEEMKARTLAVARGERRVARNEPKVWFASTSCLPKSCRPATASCCASSPRRRPARSMSWRGSPARPSPTCHAHCERWKATAWSALNVASAAASRQGHA